MGFPKRPVSVLAVVMLLLAGCDKKNTVEPSVPAALQRPVLSLEPKAGRVLVPHSALIERSGVPGVFVLSGEDQARFRMVRTGKRMHDQVEILSGLRGNETLVTGELSNVHDGSLIKKK